jgi:single-strand DNA-binding protein
MASFNKVILIGNLTRDPELKYTPSGTAVAEFGLAMDRAWTSREGEKREEVCFVDVSAFGKQAEAISNHLHKGSQACVEGRLTLDQWEAQDGQKRSKLKVTAESVTFLGGQPKPAQSQMEYGREKDERRRAEQAERYRDDDEIPF